MLLQLGLDVLHGKLELLVGRDEVLGGVNLDVGALPQQLAGEGVELDDALDLVAPELDAHGHLVLVRGHDLQRVPPHTEVAPRHVVVVALVLHVHELADQAAAAALLALPDVGHEALVLLGRAQAEDARDRRHYEHVAPGQQGPRGRVAQPVELLVDVGLLLDVRVRARHVRLGLVVVVVADEVLDGVLGEEFLKLRRELGRQRLVVRDDQRGPVQALYHAGHRERLTAARHAEQCLVPQPLRQALREPRDGLRLVAGRIEVGYELELRQWSQPQGLDRRKPVIHGVHD